MSSSTCVTAPPVVVGHSFGGRIAVCLAALYPDRVGSLVLTGVPLVKQTPSPATITALPDASGPEPGRAWSVTIGWRRFADRAGRLTTGRPQA